MVPAFLRPLSGGWGIAQPSTGEASLRMVFCLHLLTWLAVLERQAIHTNLPPLSLDSAAQPFGILSFVYQISHISHAQKLRQGMGRSILL